MCVTKCHSYQGVKRRSHDNVKEIWVGKQLRFSAQNPRPGNPMLSGLKLLRLTKDKTRAKNFNGKECVAQKMKRENTRCGTVCNYLYKY
jgi:hypothetical protein